MGSTVVHPVAGGAVLPDLGLFGVTLRMLSLLDHATLSWDYRGGLNGGWIIWLNNLGLSASRTAPVKRSVFFPREMLAAVWYKGHLQWACIYNMDNPCSFSTQLWQF